MSRVTGDYRDDTYIFRTAKQEAQIELTRIRSERGGDIKAEVEVRWNGQPTPGLLWHGTLNLLAERSVKTLANNLSDRVGEHDWYATLTAVTYLAKKRYREGEPPIPLHEVDQGSRPRWLIRPVVEYGGPTVVAAPGGSAKSLLALAAAATVATGRGKFLQIKAAKAAPVLYLDWEADRYAHNNRLEAMCNSVGLPMPENLFYRREYAPLYESADELARHVATLEAGMVVVDSKGASLSGAPEDADGTLRFFRAIRQLQVPTLVVDHVTNETAHGRGQKRPFGSVYTQNMARNVWMARSVAREGGETTVLWEHTKSNNGPTGTRLAFRLEFGVDDDERYTNIDITQVSPISVTALPATEQSLRYRIEQILRDSQIPTSVRELVDLTGASEATIRARLNEGKEDNQFANVSKPGRPGRWTTADQVMGNVVQLHNDDDLPDPW